jgi:hypothetical protein
LALTEIQAVKKTVSMKDASRWPTHALLAERYASMCNMVGVFEAAQAPDLLYPIIFVAFL